MAAPFRIYNTLSRRVEDFEPVRPGHVGLYVCGMTVYDRAHVGHARAFVVFDTFVRYLRHRGWDVTFVRNFTDVDDKIIQRAAERDMDPMALSRENIAAYHEDVDALGLIRPDHEPRVSESIEDILGMIGTLVEQGSAYVQDGSTWFAVESFEEYGKLSGQKLEGLQSPETMPGKRHPADFALWKAAKPGEPTWESPFGPGRPGWHIECSAMAAKTLGVTIDIHGGGLDLVFPHHENEVAQSEACHHAPFARYWMHNGLLNMSSGQKMGKSLGNAINIDQAVARFPAEALRLYYLQNHYRSPLPWDEEALPVALSMLNRLYSAREVAEAMGGQERVEDVVRDLGEDAQAVVRQAMDFEDAFFEALDEDFNTSKALSLVFELARAVNRFGNHKKARKRGGPVVAGALTAFRLVGEALGLLQQDVAAFHEEVKTKRLADMGVDPAEVEQLIADRTAARAAKDWATADRIRARLTELSIEVRDLPGGVEWRVRLA